MSDDVMRNLLFTTVILLAPVNVFVTYRLLSLTRKTDGSIKALNERATVAVLLSIGSVAGAILSFAGLTGHRLPPVASIGLNAVAAIVISVPALYWYIKYRTDGFKE